MTHITPLEALRPFRDAGVLAASDVHVAVTLCRLADVTAPSLALAAALATRAPRLGHVAVDLSTIARSVTTEVTSDDGEGDDLVAALPWPPASSWTRMVEHSPLVNAPGAALVVHGGLLYLERYRRYEEAVAEQLLGRAQVQLPPIAPSPQVVDLLLDGPGSDRQREAVDAALAHGMSVLVGGPGTGKTTTVAALLASLLSGEADARGERPAPRIALAAPTGKAAARLGEAVRLAAAKLPPELAERLDRAESSTIHRLLGTAYGSRSTMRHHAGFPLPHDVVIVDETSMVSLPLMAKLLDAVRPDARVVLVGDPGQLVSVEAGTVLADIAGPSVADPSLPATLPLGPLAASVTVLEESRRFPAGSALDRFARAARSGDIGVAFEVLEHGADTLTWIPMAADEPSAVSAIREIVTPALVAVASAAAAGDADGALGALDRVRVLCAHRRHAYGVEAWNRRAEGWLATAGHAANGWYPGRPVLITANDYRLGLFNGDLGVVVLRDERPVVEFPPGLSYGPARLDELETAHAMTIHKSQGSEFDHVVVVLPPPSSRLATRELLYTAVTRARKRVTLVGDREAVAAAISGKVSRASGLSGALWPTS